MNTCETCSFFQTRLEVLGKRPRKKNLLPLAEEKVCIHAWFNPYDCYDGGFYDTSGDDYCTQQFIPPPSFGCIHHTQKLP